MRAPLRLFAAIFFAAAFPGQACLLSQQMPAAPGLVLFDGATPRSGDVSVTVPWRNERARTVQEDPQVLLGKLLTLVTLKGTSTERQELAAAFAQLLRTKVGRSLAKEFVAEGAEVVVIFGKVEGSAIALEDGRNVLMASGGNFDSTGHPPEILINRDYLKVDPEYRRVHMAATLGHELFGHALEGQRAQTAGVSAESLKHARIDEIDSDVIGWTVEAELSGKLRSPEIWSYMSDPDAYQRALATNQPYYSTTLSSDEMKDPIHAVAARRMDVAAARQATRDAMKTNEEWRPIIAHFVTVHRVESRSFDAAIASLDGYKAWAMERLKTLDAIDAHIDKTLAAWDTPDGRKELGDIARTGDSAYLRGLAERLARRTEELRRAAPASQETSYDISKGAAFTLLKSLYEEDKKEHPEHWQK